MTYYPTPRSQDPVSKLIFELSKLPGIGEKTATRLSYFLLKEDEAYAHALAHAILNAKQKMCLCQQCFTLTEVNPCRICANQNRDQTMICIVERPADVCSIEQVGAYQGVYHVLHGALSPLDGIGPQELKISELMARLTSDTQPPIQELILATNPSVEGEATAHYLVRLMKPFKNYRCTQLAHGLPVGGLLEYSDKQTIGKAFEKRTEVT